VKQLAPNEIGAYDMTGNVKEWNFDWFGPDGVGLATSGSKRISRGGSFSDLFGNLQNHDRGNTAFNNMHSSDPHPRTNKVGLRIAYSAE
jgi:formylglycine-generating enzyme required for sulfatase activity